MTPRKHRILIVEDAVIVALHIKKSLELAMFDVLTTVKSGEEALKFINDVEVPDLILMDIMLDGELDGIETAGIIKKDYSIPIIYLTALTDKNTIERAKITEPFSYVMKPFNEQELHTNIFMALHKSAIENKLRESEERFLSTVKSIGDMLVTIDTERKITFLNEAIKNIIGCGDDQIGKEINKVFEFILPETRIAIDLINLIENNKALPEHLQIINNKTRINHNVGGFSVSEIRNNRSEIKGKVVIFRNIENKIIEEELRDKLNTKNLATLIEGQEIERTRVAREIHDGLGQHLTGLKINLSLLVKEMNTTQGEDVLKMVDDAITETKRISENLIPLQLNELELPECLESLCRVGDGNGIYTEFHTSLKSFPISMNIKVNMYRMTQEALNNAYKHSNANAISVQLNKIKDNLLLTIEDDGIGFDVDNMASNSINGRGLRNIKDRVTILNGKIDIHSSPELGSVISIVIPTKTKQHD